MLYALAYPEITDEDRRWIDAFRSDHDRPYVDVVQPHFTLVFGCDTVDETTFGDHVAQVAAVTPPISFQCRYAMRATDHASERGHVFLVPDEGFSSIARLHDHLYTGPLEGELRLDIEFTPHITIGTLRRRADAKALCDTLNAHGVSVAGRIGVVTVSRLAEGRIRDLRPCALAG